MAPAASFHAQLASIMEVLANTAVAEICELVDESCALLRLEAARSRRENEALRRKLRLMELRAARAQLPGTDQSGGGAAPPTAVPCRPEAAYLTPPTGATDTPTDTPPVAAIKVEQDESWTPAPPQLVCHGGEQTSLAPPPPAKQEAEEDVSTLPSWASGGVPGSGDDHESALLESQRRHDSPATHDASHEDPGCSYTRSSALSEETQAIALHQDGPQGPPPPPPTDESAADWPRPLGRRGRWRAEDGGVARGGSRFVCSCCGKRLACLKNLKTHMRVHTGEKPFACARCGKRFSDSSNLKRHQSVHTGERRYGCVHCGKRFAQSGSLKVHMSVHGDCKQFACSLCGKTFISSSHLRRHLSAHAGEGRGTPPPPP